MKITLKIRMHANWDEICLTQVGHISRVNQG